jgi:hypothetical protein
VVRAAIAWLARGGSAGRTKERKYKVMNQQRLKVSFDGENSLAYNRPRPSKQTQQADATAAHHNYDFIRTR